MPNSNGMNESADKLWNRIKQGDEKAFDALFDQLYPNLCSFANRLLKNLAEAEETVQDVFINLWQNRDKILISGSLKPYLYQSVHNLSVNKLNHFRTLKYKPNTNADDDLWLKIHNTYSVDDSLIQMIEAKETEALIRKAVDDLPAKCKEVFLLSRYEDYTYEEIADKLNISHSTVRVQIFKALNILKEVIDKIYSK